MLEWRRTDGNIDATLAQWPQYECGPRLVVIGVQKGGTRALARYLKSLPWIHVGKEVHFFDNLVSSGEVEEARKNVSRLQERYLEKFGMKALGSTESIPFNAVLQRDDGTCKDFRTRVVYRWENPDIVQTDVTPIYMITPGAPQMIKSVSNSPKILMLLRDPAERTLSAFRMEWRNTQKDEDVLRDKSKFASKFHERVAEGIKVAEDCLRGKKKDKCRKDVLLDNVVNSLVWRGMYQVHLEKWFEVFKKRNILIWVSEKFSEDPGSHMLQLQKQFQSVIHHDANQDFTNTESGDEASDSNAADTEYGKVNADTLRLPPDEKTMEMLRKFFKKYTENLLQVLRSKGYYDTVKDIKEHWQR